MKQRTRWTMLAQAITTLWAAMLWMPLGYAQQVSATNRSEEPNPRPIQAGAFALKVEPGLALALTSPQSDKFKLGGGANLKALWALNRYLGIGPSAGLMAMPTVGTGISAGTAWTAGAGLRVARPHDAQTDSAFAAMSPWLDADALYVRTGPLDRSGFQVGAGLSLPVGASRVVWVGPFVRYLHILQPEKSGFDNTDAKMLTVGLSLEVGSGVERPPEVRVVTKTETVIKEVIVLKEVAVCQDRDKDGLPDVADNCPDVAGPIANLGCPEYKKIVVKKDRLELKEKIFFDWDKSTIKKVSHPLLNDVVQALKDNHGFHVQIEGHTSSEGLAEHNQELSESRAASVREYLVSHGIQAERLVSKGFGPSQPIDSNKTPAGREANRRVEFVVQQVTVDSGSN